MRLAAVTGSRADWGLLSPPLELIRSEPGFELQLIVTGQHLEEPGGTWRAIVADGYRIDARVEMLLASDTAVAVTKSLGLAVIGFAEVIEQLDPELILLLGDRYEILAAAAAALLARVPVAHVCGGDLTEGAVDDAIRHSITKMSHLHFVSNEAARRRVIQLGEMPERVFLVGSPGLDRLQRLGSGSGPAIFDELGIAARRRNIVVTFHPETLARDTVADSRELIAALEGLPGDVGIVVTGANADTQGREINRLLAGFAEAHERAHFCQSLGSERYLRLLASIDMVVGNSSSGLYEAPSFGIPTVNIGARQLGRPRAGSIIDCRAERKDILSAMLQGFDLDCSRTVNPYGDGHASERIIEVLKSITVPRSLVAKRFNDTVAA